MIALLVSMMLAQAPVPLHIMEHPQLTLKLMAAPCADEATLEMIRPPFRDKWRAAESDFAMLDGSRREFAGCWREMTKEEVDEDSFYVIFGADGDKYAIPKSKFRPAEGQTGI